MTSTKTLGDALSLIENRSVNAKLAAKKLKKVIDLLGDQSLDDWAEGFSQGEMRQVCRRYVEHVRERCASLLETIEIAEWPR